MTYAAKCALCEAPLTEVRGPELMDREGRIYHLSCWCRMMDITLPPQGPPFTDRLQVVALRKMLMKRIADRLHSATPPPSAAA